MGGCLRGCEAVCFKRFVSGTGKFLNSGMDPRPRMRIDSLSGIYLLKIDRTNNEPVISRRSKGMSGEALRFIKPREVVV